MKNKNILVLGSANRDVILSVERNPMEGETILSDKRVYSIGGKGSNRSIALSRMGASAYLCCKLGDDKDGQVILSAYKDENVNTDYVFVDRDGTGTGTAYILLDKNGKNSIVNYMGTNNTFTEDDIGVLVDGMKRGLFAYLSIELEISLDTIRRVIAEAKVCGLPTIVDAGPVRELELSMFEGVYIFSPNQKEAEQFSGISISSLADAKTVCMELYKRTGAQLVLIKLGGDGAMLYDGNTHTHFPACEAAGKVVDTTAAGDCFMGALTHGLVEGKALEEAISYANVAAAIAVSRPGALASMPYGHEVDALYKQVNS